MKANVDGSAATPSVVRKTVTCTTVGRDVFPPILVASKFCSPAIEGFARLGESGYQSVHQLTNHFIGETCAGSICSKGVAKDDRGITAAGDVRHDAGDRV